MDAPLQGTNSPQLPSSAATRTKVGAVGAGGYMGMYMRVWVYEKGIKRQYYGMKKALKDNYIVFVTCPHESALATHVGGC
jgi:hypothetical protein